MDLVSDSPNWYYYPIAFVLGVSAGLSELLSRHRWSLVDVVPRRCAARYYVINGVVAVVTYCVAVEWKLQFGLDGHSEIWRVTLVALFAMALLRSSFANIQVGEKEWSAGLAGFFGAFSKEALQVLDRELTNERWTALAPYIQSLVYASARPYLVTVAETTLQSMSEADRKEIRKQAETIDNLVAAESVKMHLLAMLLVSFVGQDLFVSFAKSASTVLAPEAKKESIAAEKRLSQLEDAKRFFST